MRKILRGSLRVVMLTALLIPAAADACRCIRRTPSALARAADAIVMAEVTGIDDRDAGVRLYRLRVLRSWKAPLSGTMAVRSDATTCRAEFAKGQRYLIYARRTAEGYRTDGCAGNLPADRARIIATALGTANGDR